VVGEGWLVTSSDLIGKKREKKKIKKMNKKKRSTGHFLWHYYLSDFRLKLSKVTKYENVQDLIDIIK